MADTPSKQKISLENIRTPSDLELDTVSKVISDFYKFRNLRSGAITQFQNHSLEGYLSKSRELFWNSLKTPSQDLSELNLDLSIGFVRKEVMDFIPRLVGQNFTPRLTGEGLDIFGVKVLQAIYNKWRFKSNDKVEKFWQVLYGQVNGTVPIFVGYNDSHLTRRYLKSYDKETGVADIVEKDEAYWGDVWTEIVPLEDIYLKKTWERNIQKQGRIIWKTEMDWKDFQSEFDTFDNAEYVYPGNQIAEDSLYFRLLDGMGVVASDKVQLLKCYDTIKDEYIAIANGVWLNPVGKGRNQQKSPMPFDHKMMPFVWGITEPVDEKWAYGLSLPFKLKDPHKILNTSVTMMLEREFRAIDPPILTSDFEAPKLIFGQHKTIPVNDVNSYKEMNISEPSPQFYNMMSTMQGFMTSQAQGDQVNAAPSRQPKSAKEVMAVEALRQQALANALTMYYDVIRQETMLVLKTALQFYPIDKYRKEDQRIVRSITLPDSALTTGGVGTLEVRLVNKKQDDMTTFFESVDKSIKNGRTTEIIEAPVELLQNLEFEITNIELEPEKSDDIKKASFFEQVITPMLNIYVPAGVADIGKVYLRHLEKMGEHPADFSSDKILPSLMASWGGQPTPGGAQQPGQQGQPNQPGAQANNGPQTGAMQQSVTGTRFGSQGGAPITPPAGQ